MDIDCSHLTFRDASKEEKKRLFRLMNFYSFLWLGLAVSSFLLVFLAPTRFRLMTLIGLGIAALVLIFTAVSDMPARSCKICYGTISNKREVSASCQTGLYYNAVTFTSEKGEVIESFPIYSDKDFGSLSEGSRAAIVLYNKRAPALFPEERLH